MNLNTEIPLDLIHETLTCQEVEDSLWLLRKKVSGRSSTMYTDWDYKCFDHTEAEAYKNNPKKPQKSSWLLFLNVTYSKVCKEPEEKHLSE